MGIEELNVSYKSKGEAVNPNEKENSATYPENVIILRGRKIAKGMVTYSGNGDGKINLCEVPSYLQEGIIPKGKTIIFANELDKI